MKVGVVASFIHRARPGLYGSESQTYTLARGLVDAGHQVVFVAAAGSTPVGEFCPLPCGYGSLYPNEEGRAYDWYWKELRDCDLLLDWSATHRLTEATYFWERAAFPGTVLWNHQGNIFTSPRPPVLAYYPGVVVSKAQKTHALEHHLDPYTAPKPHNIHVVPYGVDTDVYTPVARPTRDYFLYLSRPHPDKGLGTFLQLAGALPSKKFVMAFDMAAEDHRHFGSQAIEQAKGVPNLTYVPLNGSLQRKVDLYANAKALVLPLRDTYLEGFGLVVAEALSCGTPVITATHGGQMEILTDGAIGTMCHTLEQYVEALGHIDELSPEACRRHVERQYSVPAWVARYETLYERLRA